MCTCTHTILYTLVQDVCLCLHMRVYYVYVCTYVLVSLPVQSAGGEMVVAEATVKGKRKEAIVQCALEACRLLDGYGMLRQASQSEYSYVLCCIVCSTRYSNCDAISV